MVILNSISNSIFCAMHFHCLSIQISPISSCNCNLQYTPNIYIKYSIKNNHNGFNCVQLKSWNFTCLTWCSCDNMFECPTFADSRIDSELCVYFETNIPVIVPIKLNIRFDRFNDGNHKKFLKHPLNLFSEWNIHSSRPKIDEKTTIIHKGTPSTRNFYPSILFQLLFLSLIPPGKLRLRLDDSYLPFEENKLNFRLGVMFHENRSRDSNRRLNLENLHDTWLTITY